MSFSKLPRFNGTIPYTQEDLASAVLGLGLPTWSRGFVPCTEASSEVTCDQVVKAWRRIRLWEDDIAAQNCSRDVNPRLLHVTLATKQGMANRMMLDTIAATIAMMTSRSVSVDMSSPSVNGPPIHGNVYLYPNSSVFFYSGGISKCPHLHQHLVLKTASDFNQNDVFDKSFEGKHLLLSTPIMSQVIYLHPQISEFCRQWFGAHAQ
jgi:hypothetical protein